MFNSQVLINSYNSILLENSNIYDRFLVSEVSCEAAANISAVDEAVEVEVERVIAGDEEVVQDPHLAHHLHPGRLDVVCASVPCCASHAAARVFG